MRLIVGADLEPEDVKAILAGDAQRLAAQLNKELNQPETWPEKIRNGVTLLAWMIARGYLEVRVAFRLHRETGQPLPFDAMEDGYVHEKWFILQDELGNRLYGTGTLNESKTALILNAENIDIHCDWWGETDRQRVNEAVESFENLWQNRVPHLPVLTLPEAVRRQLIRLAEGISHPVELDGTPAVNQVVEPPSAMERLRFAILRDAPKMPGGRFVGMETAPVEPWPHQTIVVRRLVETWPYSYLLCDEVGLGKTIEAGLAFRSLYLSGLVKRILIAAPASLTSQWHRQMASKLLLSFGRIRTTPKAVHEYLLPMEENRAANSLFGPDLVIVSTGLLVHRERAATIKDAEPFDIVLVDEAHAARRQNPAIGLAANPEFGQLYTVIRDCLRPQARSLWLATATPMQIHPVEVCDLLALTNRVGAFQFDPTLTLQYYEVLSKLVQDQEPNDYEWEFLRRAVQSIQKQDPLLWQYFEGSVIDGRIRTAVRQWLENRRRPRGRDRKLMTRLLFSAAPLSRVMLRHNRRLLEIYQANGQLQQNLAKRHILKLPRIEFRPLERQIYDQLEEYCQGLTRQIQKHANQQSRQMMSFLLSFLRLRFASSLYAIRETLQRRLHRVEATLRHQLIIEAEDTELGPSALQDLVLEGDAEDDQVAVESMLKKRTTPDLEWEQARLKAMLASMSDLSETSSKMQVLLQTLDQRRDRRTGRIRQTVIFTRFYDTLKDIVARLHQADPRMWIGTYSGQGAEYFEPDSGQKINLDREEVKERFLRGEIDVLVCTDAAAEGLNLQTADWLVNFDLGWNPMKVEQRIGRIDRIGQKHKDIYVQNLCYLGSAEEIVYGRLLKRLAEANMIVGTQQLSLLPVEPEDFLQLAEGKMTEDDLVAKARERIALQRKNTESMEIDPQALYEIYLRLAHTSERWSAPVNLPAIGEALCGSRYLRDLGCLVLEKVAEPTLILSGIEQIPDGTVMTISRRLYEEGLGDGHPRVHFASYGDPFFDAILEHFAQFKLPPCVRRISIPVPGMPHLEMVGFAVASQRDRDSHEVRLIRAWNDLAGLNLAESHILTEAEIEPVRAELIRIAREEYGPYLAAERIERENVRAARAQEMLNYYVSHRLLKERAWSTGEEAPYWTLQREVDLLYEDRERLFINDLPASVFRPLAEELLFDCQVPSVGDKASLYVPHILAKSAMDAANRLANSMKVRRSELRAKTVMTRLLREAEARRQQWSR